MPFFNGETKWLQQLCKRKDSQILSQILHFLNFDLTPIYKGGFCCPLYSHASVFRFRSKLELLGPSMEYSFSNKPNEAPRGLWNSTFVDNYERSNYLKNFWHVCLAMIRQLVRLWVKYRLPCCCIKRGRSPTEDNLNTASTLRQVKKRGLNKWWDFCLASFLFWTVMHIG